MNKEEKLFFKHVRKSESNLLRTFWKTLVAVILILVQVVIFYFTYTTAGDVYVNSFYIYNLIRILAVVYILTKHDSSQYKLGWVLVIMFLPIMGITVYILWGNSRLRAKKKIAIKEIENNTNYLLDNSFEIDEDIKVKDRHVYNTLKYIQNITSYPVCENLDSKYYDLGDKVFVDLKKDLLEAKKYIFLEFYIIDSGEISDDVFRILKKKAQEGVDVKLIYDAYGCINKFKHRAIKELRKAGVEVYAFNPFSILINSYFNNRMHRKVVVIDGKISYTGGFNLADEYANIKEKYGHWKDAGIRFKGEISWSFALLFLRDLQLIDKKLKIDYDGYKKISLEQREEYKGRGICVALSDGPNNRKNPIETVYMQILNTATDYVYITTPYFAISEEMLASVLNAARSGVDIRIILPHIPDKRIVQMSTRSYYEVLLSAGVKVYEYKPGFIHSKTFVSDDKIAIVGSANMDYRSMNLNYEDISYSFDTGVEADVKRDFENMIEKSCIEITLQNWLKRPWIQKVIESVFTSFSTMF